MPMTTAGRNRMIDQLAAVITHVAPHNVDAPTDNTTEPSGGSPAYARKAVSWNASSGGSATASTSPVFDIPAAFTVKSIGFWSALTNGTLYASADVTDEVFAGQGTYTLTSATLATT